MPVATDVPLLVLGAGGLLLAVCTVLLSLTFPWLPRVRWRRRSRPRSPRWRAVTGPPPALPAGPPPAVPVSPAVVRRPARQPDSGPHVHRHGDAVSEAEATIEHLLDTDPDRLARLMMDWIRTEDGRGSS